MLSFSPNLVHIKVINSFIKHMIEIIEKLNDLMRSAVRTNSGEADNVTEEDRDTLKHLGLGHLSLNNARIMLLGMLNLPFFSFLMTDVGNRELRSFSVFLFSAL